MHEREREGGRGRGGGGEGEKEQKMSAVKSSGALDGLWVTRRVQECFRTRERLFSLELHTTSRGYMQAPSGGRD